MASIEKTDGAEEVGNGVQAANMPTLLSRATAYRVQVAVNPGAHHFYCSRCESLPGRGDHSVSYS